MPKYKSIYPPHVHAAAEEIVTWLDESLGVGDRDGEAVIIACIADIIQRHVEAHPEEPKKESP